MLYAWLAQTDERKFDLAFQRYYAEASPSLMRYLARRSNLTDLDCEQIAVDALLKFFCRVGRDRRQAAESISHTLPQIEPLNLGPFHVRHVRHWRGDVDTFRTVSMTFRPSADEGAAQPWKAEVQAQNDGLPVLQRQGVRILDSVRAAVAAVADLTSATDGSASAEEDLAANAGAGEVQVAAQSAAVRAFAEGLRDAAQRGLSASAAAEGRHPGVVSFVGAAWTVLDVLPVLRIPTNGYLFDIAQSLYLDECKLRARKKRGGGGNGSYLEPPDEGIAPFALDPEPWDEEGQPCGGATAGVSLFSVEAVAADPAGEQIDEDFCERFFAYLRKPLEDAQQAYERAAAAGKGTAERKRLESVSEKHARLMSVLSMRIEGHTQEAIAESLGLTRNQVKYMTEHVQDAYQQFCAAALRPSR